MSGAEALAVVSIIANIVQLVDFSVNVIERAKGFSHRVIELPKAFQSLCIILPLLSQTLSRTMVKIKSKELSEDICKALRPVIQDCQKQLQQLEKILEKIVPGENASILMVYWKALASTRQDGRIAIISTNIFNYISALTYHHSEAGALTPKERSALELVLTQSQSLEQGKDSDLETKRSMYPSVMRFIKTRLVDKPYSEWELIDEFEDLSGTEPAKFHGGVFMAGYPGDSNVKLFLTIPSPHADNRADWAVVAPNATYYPGKHAGHIIFKPDFPFKDAALWWDTPILSPFARHGQFSGTLPDMWSPAANILFRMVLRMAEVAISSPTEAGSSLSFFLHPLPRQGESRHFSGESLAVKDDWMRQCTQFFSRAYNRIDEDDFNDSTDLVLENHPGELEKITDHHRQMSCQAIGHFTNQVLTALCRIQGPFTLDGLSAEDYFSKTVTIRDWIQAEKKWAHMLDKRSFWLVSQDSRELSRNRNQYYHM